MIHQGDRIERGWRWRRLPACLLLIILFVYSSLQIAGDSRNLQSPYFHHKSSAVSRDTPDRRHLDDVSSGYCDCGDIDTSPGDVISSCGDVIRDVVLPTAFVRRRNERERQRVRYIRWSCFQNHRLTVLLICVYALIELEYFVVFTYTFSHFVYLREADLRRL